jgi:hypothetical protein
LGAARGGGEPMNLERQNSQRKVDQGIAAETLLLNHIRVAAFTFTKRRSPTVDKLIVYSGKRVPKESFDLKVSYIIIFMK